MTGAAFAVGDVVYFEVWTPANCGPGWTTSLSGIVIDRAYKPRRRDYAEHEWRSETFQRGPYMLVELANGKPWIVDVHDARTQPPVAELSKLTERSADD